MLKAKKSRLLAIILAAVIAASALAVSLGSTFAAKNPVLGDFTEQPNAYRTVAVGATRDYVVSGASYAVSSNTGIATVPNNSNLFGLPIPVTGVKAGIAAISAGTTEALVASANFQVFDDSKLTAYSIKNGGEVYLSAPGKTALRANYITTTPSNAAADIKWKSLQEGVATVDRNTGTITAVSKGAAVVVGEFTDKWGVERDLHILVGVAISLGGGDENNPNLADLMEWIAKGEAILGLPDNPYTTESLQNLQNAVNGGKNVVDMPAPTDQQVKDAVDAIKGAINGLAKKPTGAGDVIGPDAEGNYYRPVGDPPNVYEIVNPDGSLKHPRKYVYNTGDPTKGGNRPAHPSGGFFWVEDPAGSNIWKKVGGNGYLVDSPALWGGPDGAPGGGDDKEAIQMNDGSYWVHIGQNVWRKVNKLQLGLPTGGGPSEDPTYTPGTPVYEHTDGKFYIGPLGPDSDGKTYYYGDSRGPLGNGKVMSTANSQHVTDDKFYLVNGEMVVVVPVDPNGIKNVTVSPDSATVAKGGTQAFTAIVYKNNGAQDSAGVNWSVNSTLSNVSAAGVLSVAASETATSLTVTATSKTDASIKGTATVAVLGGGGGTGDPEVSTGGRELTTGQTGDNVNWVEIATWGGYSLILRSAPIKGETCFNKTVHDRSYANSLLREVINNWFDNTLPSNAPIRNYTMRNDAKDTCGNLFTVSGFSKPSNEKRPYGIDTAFAMSYGESAKFCSTQYWAPYQTNSSQAAKNNFSKIDAAQTWLRSPGEAYSGTTGATVGALWSDGRCNRGYIEYWYTGTSSYWVFNRSQALPALWVESAIFNS